MAPIQSSFSFSVSAHIKYVVSCVDTSSAWRLLALNSALFTVMHRARSIMPWGGLPSCLLKKSFDCFRIKWRRRQSRNHALCLVSQPLWSGFEVSYLIPVAGSV
jgi:hypothetical protein